jgi:hypothetical protein
MEAMHELYPQHYTMVFLGLATGLRPSSLRPLRRSGPSADILWDEAKLLVRRSHTLADEVMNTTKQKVKYRIHLPEEVVKVLRWHVETQLRTPEQKVISDNYSYSHDDNYSYSRPTTRTLRSR